MSVSFAQLGVPDSIVRSLSRRGIEKPFEIQSATLTDALAGRDVCGRAPTGSGKTLAFGIPLVVGVSRAQAKRPRALVLAPTRELAEQINTEIRTFAGSVRSTVVYGGVGYGNQFRALNQGVEILVACPGRLEDLIQQKAVNLSDVNFVVLDEADRMADMGFMPAVRRLLDQTSSKRQTLLFSATLDGDIAKLTKDYQHDPVRHEVGEETPDITKASHVFWNVAKADRPGVTAEAVSALWPSIVFCRTKHGADRLAKQLGNLGVTSVAIHGGRSQNQRNRALADFSNGKAVALVASDVAARGIHVDGVASVIHFDPPDDSKTYVHRSGRTARAGEGGVVISMLMPDQLRDARKMQRDLGIGDPITAPDVNALHALAPRPPRKRTPVAPPVEDVWAPKATRGNEHNEWIDPGDRLPYAERQKLGEVQPQGERQRSGGRSNHAYRTERNARPARDERGERSTRDGRSDRPSWESRSERPTRDNRSERPARDNRSERPARDNRGERPARDNRSEPRRERTTVGAENSRPSFWERRRAERSAEGTRERRVSGSTASAGPRRGNTGNGNTEGGSTRKPFQRPFQRPNSAR
jgi:superfamily II DNA/RNA helicase